MSTEKITIVKVSEKYLILQDPSPWRIRFKGGLEFASRFRHVCDHTESKKLGEPIQVSSWQCSYCKEKVPDKIQTIFKLWKFQNE